MEDGGGAGGGAPCLVMDGPVCILCAMCFILYAVCSVLCALCCVPLGVVCLVSVFRAGSWVLYAACLALVVKWEGVGVMLGCVLSLRLCECPVWLFISPTRVWLWSACTRT